MKGTSFDVENVHCRVFSEVDAESFSVTEVGGIKFRYLLVHLK